jgi:hypothetical protein
MCARGERDTVEPFAHGSHGREERGQFPAGHRWAARRRRSLAQLASALRRACDDAVSEEDL